MTPPILRTSYERGLKNSSFGFKFMFTRNGEGPWMYGLTSGLHTNTYESQRKSTANGHCGPFSWSVDPTRLTGLH